MKRIKVLDIERNNVENCFEERNSLICLLNSLKSQDNNSNIDIQHIEDDLTNIIKKYNNLWMDLAKKYDLDTSKMCKYSMLFDDCVIIG